MNEARAPAQCRYIMPPATPTMLPDPDALALKLAEILGGAPDRALAERLLVLCGAQLAAARPALDRVEPMDAPEQHAAALRELARHG
jgi:hypothetical protein